MVRFLGIEVNGCYFHFGQNIWRKLQAEGKTADYITDLTFAAKVKKLMALAFVPETDVVLVFENIVNDIEFRPLDFLLDYFEDTYIGRQRRGRRTQPRYPVSTWTQYDRVMQSLPRTNNAVEGWHNAFNNSVSIAHPTPARLARKLQQEEHAVAVRRVQNGAGLPAPKKRKIYERVDCALDTMVRRYDVANWSTYLADIARLININVC